MVSKDMIIATIFGYMIKVILLINLPLKKY